MFRVSVILIFKLKCQELAILHGYLTNSFAFIHACSVGLSENTKDGCKCASCAEQVKPMDYTNSSCILILLKKLI